MPRRASSTSPVSGPADDSFADLRDRDRPTVAMPAAPVPAPPFSFPVVATIAPVLASGVMWMVTQSSSVLVFALLGPVIALASFADSKLHGRRRRRRELKRFDAETVAVRHRIEEHHRAERAARDEIHPGIERILRTAEIDPDRWSLNPGAPAWVVVGRGDVGSDLSVSGGEVPTVDVEGGETPAATLRDLRAAAGRLTDAAVLVDAYEGIGVAGPHVPSLAIARACAIQLARATSPVDWQIRGNSSADWAWLAELPHRMAPPGGSADRIEFTTVRDEAQHTGLMIAVAARPDLLPRQCKAIVVVGPDGTARLTRRNRADASRPIRAEYASADDAAFFAIASRECAEREGIRPQDPGSLPGAVAFSALLQASAPPRAHNDSLRCAVGRTAADPWFVDLVAEGPHAAIGGTTGSGKSELLITWVLAMAATYSPEQVDFLLVDFKGGASFAAVASLPHTVGVVTDLDPLAAQRAIESLRAELAYRERRLADAGARAIDELPDSALARLVIVVDEFAALAGDFPELHTVFTDLAARGRSLGIHLILCTQRPSASLRDSILANCGLRISLRLHDRADSVALIGSGDATALPRIPAGRAIAANAQEQARTAQVALASREDAVAVTRRWVAARSISTPVRRPWCDPLPAVLPYADIGEFTLHGQRGHLFGVTDIPTEQRQEVARYDPDNHGNLAIHGARGSGKSTAIAAIVASARASSGGEIVLVPADPGGAWEAVADAWERIQRAPGPRRMLVIDDLDVVASRLGPEHRAEFAERLARVVREGPAVGMTSILSVQQAPSALGAVLAACDSRLLMRMPTKQDHLMAGGDGAHFDGTACAGRARWLGRLVQVGYLPALPASSPDRPAPVAFAPGGVTVLISRSARAAARRVVGDDVRVVELGVVAAASGSPAENISVRGASEHTVIVGDPEAWQSAWSVLAGLRGRAQLVFDGCSVPDYRVIAATRKLPPPVDAVTDTVWVLTPDGDVRRATLAVR